jgi:hypothetical protein
MACPDCGSPAGDLQFATSVETHGLDCGPYETFNEEFVVCRECSGRYDVCEWDATQELPEFSIPSERIEKSAIRPTGIRSPHATPPEQSKLAAAVPESN